MKGKLNANRKKLGSNVFDLKKRVCFCTCDRELGEKLPNTFCFFFKYA